MRIICRICLLSTGLLTLLDQSITIAAEKSRVTSEQVTHAIQELEQLAQKQIQENALPGLAIAVVFQDKTVYAKDSAFAIRAQKCQSTRTQSFSLPRCPSRLAPRWLPSSSVK